MQWMKERLVLEGDRGIAVKWCMIMEFMEEFSFEPNQK